MSKEKEKWNANEEELQITPPDNVGAETNAENEEREAIEAIRKFTNENDDDLGEISVKSILGGDFLMSRFMVKQIMFVMFCVLLMIIYTGNRYDSQQDAILIDSLRGRLQEVKYNVLTQSSELMNMTRQSNVERMLIGTADSLLHNSITPPYLIKQHEESKSLEDEELEEILVDSAELEEMQEDAGDEPSKDKHEEETSETKKKEATESEEVLNSQQ